MQSIQTIFIIKRPYFSWLTDKIVIAAYLLFPEKFGFHPTSNNKCQYSQNSGTSTSSVSSMSSTSSTVTTEASTTITSFWEDPVIQSILIGSGCGIGVLICIISILCGAICTMCVKYKKTATKHKRRGNATQGKVQ